MGQMQTSRTCSRCRTKTLHARRTLGAGIGIILTVITMGLFLPFWILIAIYEAICVPWRCQICGQARHL